MIWFMRGNQYENIFNSIIPFTMINDNIKDKINNIHTLLDIM